MDQAVPGRPELDPADPASAAGAAELLATAERLRRAVRDGGSWVYVSWLVGMAVATAMFLAALAVSASDAAILVVSAAFAVCVAGLGLGLLPRARVNRAGFSRRFALAVVGWGALFAAAVVVGLYAFRGEPAFWLPAAVVVALPLVLGARAEAAA
jgi:hypothetical protein